jgi:hypothetical protein
MNNDNIWIRISKRYICSYGKSKYGSYDEREKHTNIVQYNSLKSNWEE